MLAMNEQTMDFSCMKNKERASTCIRVYFCDCVRVSACTCTCLCACVSSSVSVRVDFWLFGQQKLQNIFIILQTPNHF